MPILCKCREVHRTIQKQATWSTFANTIYVTISRAFYAFHAESFTAVLRPFSDTKLAIQQSTFKHIAFYTFVYLFKEVENFDFIKFFISRSSI